MKASRVLMILICLAVSAVFGVLYIYRYVYPADESPTTAALSRAAASTVRPQVDDVPLVSTPSYSVLPRVAYAYDGVSVGVTGTAADDTLLDYYAFGGSVYVVLSILRDGEDYRAASPSIGVARFDDACTLLETLTLPDSAGYTFLAASVYDYGLMIAAASSTDVRVWAVGTNLACRSASFPYVVQSGRLLYDGGANVLCAVGDKVHLLCLTADLGLVWYHSVPAEGRRLVWLYAYADDYVAVCTDRTSGCAYFFAADGYRSRALLPAVDAYAPFADGIALASAADGKIYLFDYAYARTGEVSVSRASSIALCAYDKGLVVFAAGTGYLVCNHGDVQYTFAAEGDPIGLHYAGGRFVYATHAIGVSHVFAYVPFDASPGLVASYTGATSPRVWMGRYLYCLCESTFDYGYFAGSLGGRDVYLLRSYVN